MFNYVFTSMLTMTYYQTLEARISDDCLGNFQSIWMFHYASLPYRIAPNDILFLQVQKAVGHRCVVSLPVTFGDEVIGQDRDNPPLHSPRHEYPDAHKWAQICHLECQILNAVFNGSFYCSLKYY